MAPIVEDRRERLEADVVDERAVPLTTRYLPHQPASDTAGVHHDDRKRAVAYERDAVELQERAATANRKALDAAAENTAERASAILENASAAGSPFSARGTTLPADLRADRDMFRPENWRWIAISVLVALVALAALMRTPLSMYEASTTTDATVPPLNTEYLNCFNRMAPQVGSSQAEIECKHLFADRSFAVLDTDPLTAGNARIGVGMPPTTSVAAAAAASRHAMAKLSVSVFASLLGLLLANFAAVATLNQVRATASVLWFLSSVSGTLSLIVFPGSVDTLLYVWLFTTAFWTALAVYMKIVFQLKMPSFVGTGVAAAVCAVIAWAMRTVVFL